MRLRLYTRALTAILAVLGLASLRAMPAGSGHERALPQEPTISAAALLPVAAVDATPPTTPAATPPPSPIWPAPGGLAASAVQVIGTTVITCLAPPHAIGPADVAVTVSGSTATLYAHLSRVDVAISQTVQQGHQIGAIGATGMATGDHLHFEVRVDNKPQDPMAYLPARS